MPLPRPRSAVRFSYWIANRRIPANSPANLFTIRPDHVALRRIRPLGMVAERRTEMVRGCCDVIGHFSVVLWAFKEVARNDAGYVDQWVEGACEI